MSWKVADVMTKNVLTVGPEEDFKTCARLLQTHNISALPVVDHRGRLVGIVSEADLLAKERERGMERPFLGIRWDDDSGPASARTAGEAMTSPAISIAPTATIPEAARLMYREAVKRLPVVDHSGNVVGIISRADLLKTFTRSDASIRKDIVEEIVRKALSLDPKTVTVRVREGMVELHGELESRSLCHILVKMAERIEGTVGVESALTYRLDDSRLGVETPARALQYSADER